MAVSLTIFIVGLAVLSWSADRFVYGASALARNVGVSPMMIGLTIVAMGSSAPEIVVSATASLDGNRDTAVGNALGSNITNIALVLGITALVRPLLVSSRTVKREMPILLGICLVASWLIFDQFISREDGILLIVGLIMVLVGMAYLSMTSERNDPILQETEDEIPTGVATSSAVMWVILGLVMLPVSAHFIVESAVDIATYLGISQLVIGLTIIALGTSLPELAASVAGVLKGEDDLAMGNIVGSNIFNLLAVLAMPGLLSPGIIDPDAAQRDIFVMLGLTLLLLLFSLDLRGRRQINRFEATAFLLIFFGYQWLLFR
ncbi:calcium/sodium antiporter [Alteromonas oceanisediminis]|uniref:calcium/sodium antiporter n=1 Tax=Alteromonas oceanisediminis TaxID=2836180 RepID=UPI001BDB1C77|nr:calcium/sodium antiporter [Alteromonas oceanisediminis]MBT0585438.1 calcium/sodium antiporter [Alteromonas oceanisediminis]